MPCSTALSGYSGCTWIIGRSGGRSDCASTGTAASAPRTQTRDDSRRLIVRVFPASEPRATLAQLPACVSFSRQNEGLCRNETCPSRLLVEREADARIGPLLDDLSEEHARLEPPLLDRLDGLAPEDRKSTRLNSSHVKTSYAVSCLKKKNK